MSKDVQQFKVTGSEVVRTAKGTAHNLYVEGSEDTVFSPSGAPVGSTIYAQTRESQNGKSYLIHVVKQDDGSWVTSFAPDSPAPASSGTSRYQQKLPPPSPREVVTLYAAILSEATEQGLLTQLPKGADVSAVLNTLFIAASRPQEPYKPASAPVSDSKPAESFTDTF